MKSAFVRPATQRFLPSVTIKSKTARVVRRVIVSSDCLLLSVCDLSGSGVGCGSLRLEPNFFRFGFWLFCAPVEKDKSKQRIMPRKTAGKPNILFLFTTHFSHPTMFRSAGYCCE